jgi:two-component system response regulator
MIDILLVEDNPSDAELTLHALRQNDVADRVHLVRDGAEALDYLFCRGDFSDRSAGDLPKVILLDLKLPKVDGLEVLRQVKANERTRTVPVVVLTSSQLHRDVDESYRLGANSYIVKPVAFGQFSKAVRDLGQYWLQLNEPPSH